MHIMGRNLNENLLSSREHPQQKTINYREMTGRRKVVLGLPRAANYRKVNKWEGNNGVMFVCKFLGGISELVRVCLQ